MANLLSQSSSPSTQDLMEMMVKLTTTFTTTMATQSEMMTKMLDQNSRILEQNSRILDVVTKAMEKLLSPPPSPPIPPSNAAYYAAAVRVLQDKETIDGKATRLVGLNLEEKQTDAETARADDLFVSNLVKELNLQKLTEAYTAKQVTFHRHPQSVPSGDRPRRRPLKIQLPSAALRTATLDAIRKKRPSFMKNHPGCYVRRDLMPAELQLEREAKEEAKKLNSQLGCIHYGVRDCDVIRYSRSRPFPQA